MCKWYFRCQIVATWPFQWVLNHYIFPYLTHFTLSSTYLLPRCDTFNLYHRYIALTLMLLVANLANTKWVKKKLKNFRNPGIWVLIWECSARAFQWVPTWQGFDGFKKSLHPCALDESSLSIGRVNPLMFVPAKKAIWQSWIFCEIFQANDQLRMGNMYLKEKCLSQYNQYLSSNYFLKIILYFQVIADKFMDGL